MKKQPKQPNQKNLKKLNELCESLNNTQQEQAQLIKDIDALRLPSIVVEFAKQNPELHITSTTDKLCSVFCSAGNITKMPYGASDVHIEDEKINFKVLLD